MSDAIVHLCYAGTSGASSVAINAARGSDCPRRHAYVLYGVADLRADYAADLDRLGCQWRYVPKAPGADVIGYRHAAVAVAGLAPGVAVLHGARTAPVGLWLRLLRRHTLILGVHHGPISDFHRPAGKAAVLALSALSDRAVAVSSGLTERLGACPVLRRLAGTVRVIPNGADPSFWHAEPPAPPVDRTLRIGMVGSLAWTKDQPLALRALAQVRRGGLDATLDLAGGGPRGSELRRLGRELGVARHVRLLGPLSRRALRVAMHSWHVMLHATHGEVLSMALIEAMLAARPIVATDAPGVRDVIEDGRTGLIVRPGAATEMAAAIVRLRNEPALAASLAREARWHAQGAYSIQRMAAAYEAAADELLAR